MGRIDANGTVTVRADPDKNEGDQTSEWRVFSA